ncbi:hypothetical protein [Leucobacter sp. G161]|uniref:hypothetical protein n=1 Tax=Leucobacter sp. G161 TaxID=663704 RepID=UPI00073C385E|nr:hypothetical protein [Leucobacter sp. G161]KUF05676.1 hypothetical protein AUL38_15895 [Leucobacter sp. G161]
MDIEHLEDLAEAHSTEALDGIHSGDAEGLREFIDGRTRHELAWMVLSLGNCLVMVEHENVGLARKLRVLGEQNGVLDTANVSLFAEKRDLLERNEELRDILHGRKKAA